MIRLQLERENLRTKVPSGVIITGGGAETVGIEDSAKRMLSLSVRIGKPKGITGLVDDVIKPAYAIPVGLLLYGAAQEPVRTNVPFTSKFKFPAKGMFAKLIDSVKDLLP
jgi:cell division protein FtsA